MEVQTKEGSFLTVSRSI